MKVTIPSRLQVGAHLWTVEIRNDYRVIEGCVGATSKPALKIIIDKTGGTPESIVNERFVHELLHAVFVEAGFYQNATTEFTITEEQLIERLTPVVHQILCENKIQSDS